ncbi:MAG: hypothetical protein WKF84_18155 [Pyrinomonadaceae bacterium]
MNEDNQQKQSGDKDATQTEREGFSAEELGQASIYDDQTTIAQQMRRGDESKGDADERDTVGAANVKDTARDVKTETQQPRSDLKPELRLVVNLRTRGWGGAFLV